MSRHDDCTICAADERRVRWTDVEVHAIELTGMNWCDCGCGQELTEPFPTPVGWFQAGHEPADDEIDAAMDGAA